MNRAALLAIGLLCLVFAPNAAGGESAKARLALTTNLGARKTFVVTLTGTTVSLNGYPLPESALVVNREALAYAFSVVDDVEPRTCSSGLFEHTVIRKGRKRTERGCLEEPRLASLYAAYRELQDAAR